MPELKAIFFDLDGVIIDTEKDGHRVAFNEAFKQSGYEFEWDVAAYHDLLQVSGGKERMRHYFHQEKIFSGLTPQQEDELILRLHQRKTEIFVSLIENRKLPLRAGVKRLMKEAIGSGLILGICTTANERSVTAVAEKMLADIPFAFILAGDMVRKKKPDPEIYLLALKRSALAPGVCLVIEDSRNGVLAAKRAGLPVLATTNPYTENEDLSEADIVVTSLGEPGGKQGNLKSAQRTLAFSGVMRVDQLISYFST